MTSSHPKKPDPVRAGEAPREFDGIVCFGGVDWWYHNRGHYDLQMMRELSEKVPVLYVNSIGMRIPRLGEGTVLLGRIARKIQSLNHGTVRIRDNFTVHSPFMLPSRFGRKFLRRFLSKQVRRAAWKAGIRRPLVWVACPPAVQVLEDFRSVAVVYQRTDRFEEYPNVDPEVIGAYDRELKQRADLTLYCSSLLFDEERDQCRAVLFADHGVDYSLFAEAGESPELEPEGMKGIPHPRIGYIGNLEPHRVDYQMLLRVAEKLSHLSFVVVGPCALPEDWCTLPNVHQFGQQPYEEVRRYMAACDVLIMPWNENEWIRACNPVKLKEYLAVGRPVVTTPFEELRNYKGFVSIASGDEAFSAAILSSIENPPPREFLRGRVVRETWGAKADLVLEALSGLCVPSGKKEV